MLKLKNVTILEYIITTALSAFSCVFLYKYLYEVWTYTNLKDFYVGTTIYLNHNKYLDISIFFVYLIFFFMFLPAVKFLFRNYSVENTGIDKIDAIKLNIPKYFLKFQYLGLLGYVLLHPFNGIFYPKLALFILILFIIGIIDIKHREQKSISPFALAPILFIFYFIFNTYSVYPITIDDHHFGEQLATYYLHEEYSLKYYKDIMLVHGFLDVFPAYIGHFFFGEISIYSFKLGTILVNNIIQLTTLIIGLYIFSSSYIYISPLLLTHPHLSILYFSTYILLITKKIKEKPLVWLLSYITITTIFMLYWTTIGTFCLICTIPFAIYMLCKLIKGENAYLKCLTLILFCIILYLLTKDFMSSYLEQAAFYVKGNLFAFGNNFGKYDFSMADTITYSIKLFSLLISPFLIIALFNELRKDEKEIDLILLLTFFTLFPVISLSYTLGRIDWENFSRICNISSAYLCLVLPYYLYRKYKESKTITLIMQVVLIIVITLFLFKLPSTNINLIDIHKKSIGQNIEPLEKINISQLDAIRIKNIQNFVKNNSKENEFFLDLTNRGMNYFYVQKNIPIPYTSYYNSISSKQDSLLVEKIKINPPKIILIGYYQGNYNSTSPIFDDVLPAIRIPQVIKWILLNNNYNLIIENGIVYLVKTDKLQIFNKSEIRLLDELFSQDDLKFLPEAWGSSINSLPVELTKVDYRITKNKNEIKLIFDKEQNGATLELMYIENASNGNYELMMNNESYKLKFSKKRNGAVLIPIYNVPSYILNKKIKELIIKTDNNIEDKIKITFYKRKMT